MFSPTRLKFITLPLGFTSPFASVAMEPRQAMSYRSFFDIKRLVANAQSELSRSDPEAFKAFLLASMVGLRRAEIDQLEWTAFDWQLEKLHIGVTEHFAVKSQGSIGDVDRALTVGVAGCLRDDHVMAGRQMDRASFEALVGGEARDDRAGPAAVRECARHRTVE